MSELRYVLLSSDPKEFDCGNPAINEYVATSYFATLNQQCYAYKILYNSHIVGYYMITLRDVAFDDCVSEISDYQAPEFGNHIPSLYINYLAIDSKFQNKKIGTKTIEKIILETREWTDFLPIRLITINAVPDKIEWYKKIGFSEMRINHDAVNTYMYLDLIKNKKQLVDYSDEQLNSYI